MKKAVIAGLGIGMLLVLLVIALVNVFYRSKEDTGQIINSNVTKLAAIFERIHTSCQIIDFDQQKTRIDFLNVTSFVGSEVGGMNMANPHGWEGPYLLDNPTIQDKEYQIVQTVHGYYITPGDGVKLPNGKVVGTDILLDKEANIGVLSNQEENLAFNNKPLAVRLDLSTKKVTLPVGLER